MSERTTGIRAALGVPAIYELLQRTLGAERVRRRLAGRVMASRPSRVLDLGCGPAHLLPHLPPTVEYVGVDHDPDYIRAARNRFGDRGTFVVGDASRGQDISADFDVVISQGVVHHLDDDQARRLVREARSYLGSRGRLITIDPVRTPGQSRVSRLLMDADRGACIRTARAYEALVATAFDSVEVTVFDDLLRVPYEHALLEAAS